MKVVNLLLAILVSALIGLGVLELGLRVIGLGPPKGLNEPHERLGWTKKKDTTVRRATPDGERVTFALNEHGMRDDPVTSKGEDTFRVVCLGDSFTLGFTVERDDLFVDLLERRWRAEGRPVDVLNAGTEGYSTDQEVVWLMEHGEELRPDLVLLFPYENDIYWNGQESYFGDPKPRFRPDGTLERESLDVRGGKPFLERTALGRLFVRKKPELFVPAGGTRAVLREWAPLMNEPPDFLADATARTGGALKALKEECARLGCEAVVVPIPSHSAIDPTFAEQTFTRVLGGLAPAHWSADEPVELLLGAARAAGLATLDPRSFLKERFRADETDLYFDKDWHFNPAGNRVFAEFVHAELDRLGLLPAAEREPAPEALTASSEGGGGGIPTWGWLFAALWTFLGASYATVYRREENPFLAFVKVGALLAVIFTIAVGGGALLGQLPPAASRVALVLIVLTILGFVAWKLGDRLGTITELMASFVGRGHWYLMPLVVVLLTVGSLLVVAASSPLVAPFIYTLF